MRVPGWAWAPRLVTVLAGRSTIQKHLVGVCICLYAGFDACFQHSMVVTMKQSNMYVVCVVVLAFVKHWPFETQHD